MLFFLRDCNDDIGGYFVNCYLFVEGLIEMDFILVRVGLFLVIELQIEIMFICVRYRYFLGKFWRLLRLCQYFDYRGKFIVVGGRYVIGLKLLKEIYSLFGENVFVGFCKQKLQFGYYSCF